VSIAASAKRDDGGRAYDVSEHGGHALAKELAQLADISMRISEEQASTAYKCDIMNELTAVELTETTDDDRDEFPQ
jgi:hypothetical protein